MKYIKIRISILWAAQVVWREMLSPRVWFRMAQMTPNFIRQWDWLAFRFDFHNRIGKFVQFTDKKKSIRPKNLRVAGIVYNNETERMCQAIYTSTPTNPLAHMVKNLRNVNLIECIVAYTCIWMNGRTRIRAVVTSLHTIHTILMQQSVHWPCVP